MRAFSFATALAASAGILAIACTATTTTTVVTEGDAGAASTSSGGSSGEASSGGSSSSSGDGTSSTSSSSSSSSSSSGGSTSSSGGSSGTPKDAGPDVVDPDPDACPQNVPLTPADLDAQVGWKSATKAAGACSAGDLTTLQNNFSNAAIASYVDLGNGLSASCKACAISYDTAASWQPIVATAADNGATGFINFGACFGSVEGAACGKALQYEQFCYNIACNECATTSTERQKCIGVAADPGEMCSGFGSATGSSCPNLQTTAAKCNTVLDAVKTLCGS